MAHYISDIILVLYKYNNKIAQIRTDDHTNINVSIMSIMKS